MLIYQYNFQCRIQWYGGTETVTSARSPAARSIGSSSETAAAHHAVEKDPEFGEGPQNGLVSIWNVRPPQWERLSNRGQGWLRTRSVLSVRVSPTSIESRCGLFFPVFYSNDIFSIRPVFRLNCINMTEKGRKSAYLVGIFMAF